LNQSRNCAARRRARRAVAHTQRAGLREDLLGKASSVQDRAKLDAAMEYCREGDVFAVTKLDRLAQSVAGLGSAGRALRPRLTSSGRRS
jgi:DNA invertase Pin-like site-specific DNA recombinase